MIYIVIGGSGAGKTTFVKNKFISDRDIVQRTDIVPYIECGGKCILGKYGLGIRTEGTDTIPYNLREEMARQTIKLSRGGCDVVVEGEKITNRMFFNEISMEKTCKKLYICICPLSTSIKRLRGNGSGISESFVKFTRTKSKRLFIEYGPQMDGEVVYTERNPIC